jgi:hypothetical protein
MAAVVEDLTDPMASHAQQVRGQKPLHSDGEQ